MKALRLGEYKGVQSALNGLVINSRRKTREMTECREQEMLFNVQLHDAFL